MEKTYILTEKSTLRGNRGWINVTDRKADDYTSRRHLAESMPQCFQLWHPR